MLSPIKLRLLALAWIFILLLNVALLVGSILLIRYSLRRATPIAHILHFLPLIPAIAVHITTIQVYRAYRRQHFPPQ